MESHSQLLLAAERGCLVLSDVSGYTDYLQATELEHAHDVLADLLGTVVRHLAPTLRINRLEGDAAFAYALEEEIEASMLLDTIEQTYFAFRARVRDIQHATTCECNACQRIPSLDLKFHVHHGQFVRQDIVGGEELTGTDVVLVHRLLKNTVVESLGVRGYAFYTHECIDTLGVDPQAMEMRPHEEHYDDMGGVSGYVVDLEHRWQYEDERRRVFVVPAEAEFEDVRTLPAPVPIVWEFVTAPDKRALWGTDVVRIEEETPSGRRGVGTTTHCVHGRGAIVEESLDWRPFRYFTWTGPVPLVGNWKWTVELRPKQEGTEFRLRAEKLQGLRRRLAWALIRGRFSRLGEERVSRLRDLLVEEQEEREVVQGT